MGKTTAMGVRLRTGEDIRRVGSGRTRGTNGIRAGGWVAGLPTGLGDLAVGLARFLQPHPPATEMFAGWRAVAGPNGSVGMGFQGGAGTVLVRFPGSVLWRIVICFTLRGETDDRPLPASSTHSS